MMNFDEIVVKESPGLCRCCLSEGCYKDMGTEYSWMTETEVYADMLLECFDISISQHSEGPNGPNRLICEVCITRLRDACNFKKQVVDSEKRFIDMLARGEFKQQVMIYQTQPQSLKEEHLQDKSDPDGEVEYLEDVDFDDIDDIPLTKLPSEPSSLEQAKPSRKRGRPKKSTTEQVAKKTDKPKVKVNRDTQAKGANPRRRRNLQTLFNNTTIIPFKWRCKYLCFYCGDDIPSYSDLRPHTLTHGEVTDRDRAIRLVKAKEAEVKIDVSDITCKICQETFLNLDDIITHLITKHKLPYSKDVDLMITPYRLEDLKCLKCDSRFDYLGKLISHLNNEHPDNCFVCNNCGQRFNKLRDLKAHMRKYHKQFYSCLKCPKTFPTSAELLNHKQNEHISVCNICFKTFSSVSKRISHMKWDHTFDGILQCGLCLKIMSTKQAFFSHASKCNTRIKTKDDFITIDDNDKRFHVKQLRNNIAAVLNMSTAIPFKHFKNKFRCFYCPKDFIECEELRQHTNMEHPFCDIKAKCMKLKNRGETGIKIDIANMSCKLCYEQLTDMENLITHLNGEHKAKYDTNMPDLFLPYRLSKNNFPCPVCNKIYSYFGILLRHMSKDHTDNRIICLYCGKSFRSDPSLRAHVNRHHKAAKHKCHLCDSEFTASSDLQTHLGRKHGIKFADCPQCDEKFTSHYLVSRHLINIHGTGHKCSYCGKLFPKNSFMMSHIKRLHLKEKNVECSICFERFFDNQRLKMHMVKHIGERNFHCDVCGKKFLWKKNLRGHMASHIKHSTSQLLV